MYIIDYKAITFSKGIEKQYSYIIVFCTLIYHLFKACKNPLLFYACILNACLQKMVTGGIHFFISNKCFVDWYA